MTVSKYYAACIDRVQMRLLLTGHCQPSCTSVKGVYRGGYPVYSFRNPPGSAPPALAAEHGPCPAR